MRSRGLNVWSKQVPAVVVVGALSKFMINPDLRRGIRVQGTLTLRGVQNPEEADQSPRREMEVMCSVPKRNVASVAILIVASADYAQMHASIAGRVDIWSRTIHRIGVRLELMLTLGLIPRMMLQLSLLRGIYSMP